MLTKLKQQRATMRGMPAADEAGPGGAGDAAAGTKAGGTAAAGAAASQQPQYGRGVGGFGLGGPYDKNLEALERQISDLEM